MNRHLDKTLGDLACELKGASSLLRLIQPLVKPDEDAVNGDSVYSEETVEYAFYSIEATLERIAEELNDREKDELLTAKAG